MYEYTVLPSMHADPKSITFTAAAVLALEIHHTTIKPQFAKENGIENLTVQNSILIGATHVGAKRIFSGFRSQ
jgi:hypothetical protein